MSGSCLSPILHRKDLYSLMGRIISLIDLPSELIFTIDADVAELDKSITDNRMSGFLILCI